MTKGNNMPKKPTAGLPHATPNAQGKPTPNKPQEAKASAQGRKARDRRYREAHQDRRSPAEEPAKPKKAKGEKQ